ncbi:MAG: ribonuclease R [Dysgonamonadaceae bacterium]|jgi:ribonuclease R|nr:ribonuclease R [Dysgonamonadaceae bacterium]
MVKKKIKANKPQKQQKNKREITQQVVSYFNNHPNEVLNYKQIGAGIEAASPNEKGMIASILETLLSEEYLVQTDRGKYRLNNICSIAEGIFERRSNGKNSFIPDTGGNPIFVAERNSLFAMNKDRVRVQIFARLKGREPEAEVIEILQHRQDTVVGVLEVSKYYAYLIVDSKLWANDIFIPKDKIKDGKTGQKAVVRIVEWPNKAKNPVGEVMDILGDTGDNHAEMHAILAEFGLPYSYPEALERAAKKISSQISREEIASREDFRSALTFTIDPKDAKDFDDALSLRKLPDGAWEVGVHIADVTHYVKPETAIDKEASERATSVYLVDRTIPMLPELLSNNLCSLRPKEDKLCFSVIFELNDRAEIRQYRIRRTVINSDRRLHYDEAQEIIEANTAHDEIEQALLDLNRLAKILREKRFTHGAINFERDEAKFDIDENGKPLRVYFREEKDANRLIEEFMLLANRTVAEFVGKTQKGVKAKTFVYRVHDEPNPEKMANFMQFVRRLGYKIKEKDAGKKNNETSRNINRLLSEVQGKKEQNLIETVAVRTMAKATYTTVNIGHYGLAFDYYTHFTSPIRRYPDMMVHRLLERYLIGGRSVSEPKTEDCCKHCSTMETLASQAERASIKYKQVEFMADKVGRIFDGIISGVTEWGLYVELNETHCEGMIPIRELNDDFYEFDEKTYSLIGKRTKKRYILGNPIRIRVTRANLEKKQLDFTLEQ